MIFLRRAMLMCTSYNLKSITFCYGGDFSKYALHFGARSFSLSISRNHKMFQEYESMFAYEVMETNGHVQRSNHNISAPALCEDLQLYLARDWSSSTPQQLYEAFRSLTKHCSENKICISNKVFDNFIDYLTDNIKFLSDDQLKTLFLDLALWPETESPRTRNFIEVWAALDDACLSRMKEWPIETKLLFAELTYHMNIARLCDYTNKCIQRLTSKASSLTPSQLLQTCFYLSVVRKSPLDKHNIELQLQNYFHTFTVSELAVMSMGFFKSQTPIRNMEIVSMIIDKIIAEAEEIDSVSLAALLKLVRYSIKYTKDDIIYPLLSAIQGQVPRLSIMACLQVALVGTATQTLHKQCLAAVAAKVATEISTARLKDLERLTLTLAGFGYHIPDINILERILAELRSPARKEEIDRFGRPYACCVSFATMLGYYPYDLIDQILGPEFLSRTYGPSIYNVGREILVLDNTIEINCPDYAGHRLPRKSLILLAKKYTDYVPDVDFKCQYNVAEKLVLDVMDILRKQFGGKGYVYGDHALTHFQRGDVFICQDKNGNAVDISSHFPIKPFGPVKRAPTDDTWIVFVIAARNSFIRGTNETTGPFKAKCRDFRKIGYHPIIVSWHAWDELRDEKEKTEYLKGLIKEAAKT